MKMSSARSAILALALTAFSAACQDHHFVPYDKMPPLPEPGAPSKTGVASPPAQQSPYQTGAVQSQPAQSAQPEFTGLIASGSIVISPESSANLPTGWTLYIIVRPAGGGPAIAAKRVNKPSFPISFELTEQDIMLSQPKSGIKISIEARYDEDGDPISKGKNDYSGVAEGDFSIGSGNAIIRLKKQTS